MVDTPQKAAIEDALKAVDKWSADWNSHNTRTLGDDVMLDHEDTIRQALTTLRDNQGCAVVTVEELRKLFETEFNSMDGAHPLGLVELLQGLFRNGLRIIAPEKKET
jgi:hypothetical protein